MEQRLRTEQGLNEKLDTAAESRLEQAGDRVVAGIRLVTREIERAIDGQRQAGVDLDAAGEPSLVSGERAPGQLADVLDVDAFGRRQA